MKVRRFVSALALLAVAGCGGGSRTTTTPAPQIDQSVKQALKLTMMTSHPRNEYGSSWTTHVRRIRCTKAATNKYRCDVTLRNGAHKHVIAHQRADGGVTVG